MIKRPCLVVGASGNIGEEIAVHLAAKGRPLALTHSPKSTHTERIPPHGDSVRWYGVDVCDSKSVTQLVKTVEQDFGAAADLVYCAGIVKDGSIMDSLGAVVLVVEVQKRYDVRIPDERMPDVRTGDQLKAIVEELFKAK